MKSAYRGSPFFPSAALQRKILPRASRPGRHIASLRLLLVPMGVFLLLCQPHLAEDVPLPKYREGTVRLFFAREYIQKQPAPDFWAIMPYHIAQPDANSCSAASAAMVINALRASRQLTARQQLATVDGVLATVESAAWRNHLVPSGRGITLDELDRLLPLSASSYDLLDVKSEIIRFPEPVESALPRLREILARNERSDEDFILVNFLQSELTGDPEGAVGHIAPVGAFDATMDRVLLFDPDRDWYEPYWVPTVRLLRGMQTTDRDGGKLRGMVWIRRR